MIKELYCSVSAERERSAAPGKYNIFKLAKFVVQNNFRVVNVSALEIS